jgi:cytochrome c biogenesis protein CcmG/thiol:disulfide interchange protein DsbE
MGKPLRLGIALLLLVVSCGGSDAGTTPGRADLPAITGPELERRLSESSRPAVVNVWASWCLPCRAEAPLLNDAFAQYGDRIEFIGVDVQDTQDGAKGFLDEFGLEFDHLFDPGRSVPRHYGGIGTPITFFFEPGGHLAHTHNGVIDERTLAIHIDELLITPPG